MYLVLFVFTSRLTSLLDSKGSVFLFVVFIYVSAQNINIVSLYQELTSSVQFQSFLIFLGLPCNIS